MGGFDIQERSGWYVGILKSKGFQYDLMALGKNRDKVIFAMGAMDAINELIRNIDSEYNNVDAGKDGIFEHFSEELVHHYANEGIYFCDNGGGILDHIIENYPADVKAVIDAIR